MIYHIHDEKPFQTCNHKKTPLCLKLITLDVIPLVKFKIMVMWCYNVWIYQKCFSYWGFTLISGEKKIIFPNSQFTRMLYEIWGKSTAGAFMWSINLILVPTWFSIKFLLFQKQKFIPVETNLVIAKNVPGIFIYFLWYYLPILIDRVRTLTLMIKIMLV